MQLAYNKKSFNYIYGPVYSWRLGESLGIDPLESAEKICNMDCIYCQLGKTEHITRERKVYVDPVDLLDELDCIEDLKFDTIMKELEIPFLGKHDALNDAIMTAMIENELISLPSC